MGFAGTTQPEYTILVRDANLNPVGQIDDYRLKMVLKFNAVSTWNLQVPIDSTAVQGFDWQGGLVVVRNGVTLLSGPLTEMHRTSNQDGDALEVNGVDDLDALDGRAALPVTTGPPYSAAAYDTQTGPAETVIKHYVDYNAGVNAKTDRKVTGLSVVSSSGRGSTITGNARFDNLLTLCSDLAIAGEDIGFSVVQSGTSLLFDIYTVRDLSASVQFSQDYGTLKDFDYSAKRAEANYIYVGGAGDGTARLIDEVLSSNSVAKYGRRELFVDNRGSNVNGDLLQQGIQTLTEKADTSTFKATPIDTGTIQFMRDYKLGDKVTAIADDVPVSDVIRQIDITVDENGELPISTIGAPNTASILSMLKRIKEIQQRVLYLERIK